MLSMTELPESIPMWSHYARDHEGFVIGFNVTNSFFKNNIDSQDIHQSPCKVEYRKKRPIFYKKTKNLRSFIYSKSKEWEYEKEWRFVKPLSDASEICQDGERSIHLFRYPVEAVNSIIFGLRTKADTREELMASVMSWGEHRKVDFFEMNLDSIDYRLRRMAILTKASIESKLAHADVLNLMNAGNVLYVKPWAPIRPDQTEPII